MLRDKALIVLGVDQARTSGWSIGHRESGDVIAWGLATTCQERAGVCARALAAAGGDPRRLYVLLEDHSAIPLLRTFGPPTRGTAHILGLGESKGYWIEHLNLMGHPERLRENVTPHTWRKRVLGIAKQIKREECKAAAKLWAQSFLGRPVDSDDIAEAVAICVYGLLDLRGELEIQIPMELHDPKKKSPRTSANR